MTATRFRFLSWPVRLLPGLLFLIVVGVAFTALYGRFGYSGADEGFVTGLAWRLTHGQLPYADFVYIRPPMSLLIHAVPLLAAGTDTMVFERFLFALFVAGYSLLSVVIVDRHFTLRPIGLNPYLLALIFFVCSVQNFPPIPWHTTDGILLSVIAVFFLACTRGAAGLVAGGVFLVLAALCKQSFFFIVPFGLIYSFVARGRRGSFVVASAVAGTGLLFLGGLAWLGLTLEFFEQITGQARLRSLINSGFLSYFRRALPGLVLFVVPYALLELLYHRVRGRWVQRAWMPYVLFAAIYGAVIADVLVHQRFRTPFYNYPGLLFLVTAVWLLFRLPRRENENWTLALMLGVSWCSGISWGFQSPMLYSAPFVFGALWLSRRYLGTPVRSLAWTVLILAAAAQFAGYQFPYRESPRALLDHDLGDVFPKALGIRTSLENHERYAELARLHQAHGDGFTVLPSMPLAHYLTDTVPTLPIDWATDAEAGARYDRILESLEREVPLVFLERQSSFLCDHGPICSTLALHVQATWSIRERGRYLDVYGKED